MKLVSSFEIIGNPEHVETIKHPFTGQEAKLLADGSIFCLGEYLAPEPGDGRYFDMRRAFDQKHGLTPSERRLIANGDYMAAVKQGCAFLC